MKSFRFPVFVVAWVAVGLTGCFASSMANFKSNGLTRASFDLSCPADQLTATPLNDAAKSTSDAYPGSLVGVSGCGKQAVYVMDDNQAWIMNSAKTH